MMQYGVSSKLNSKGLAMQPPKVVKIFNSKLMLVSKK